MTLASVALSEERQMRVVFIALALLLFALPAMAFEPASGSRAYPIAGRDMISGDHYDLEALRGKWVFLEFWASW